MTIKVDVGNVQKAAKLSYDICSQLVGNEDFIGNSIVVTDTDSHGAFYIIVKQECKTNPAVELIIKEDAK